MDEIVAILPVAGNATRLRPITDHKPKALVEVAGKPVIEHILLNLAHSQIRKLVLVVGHLKEVLIDWIEANFGNQFNLKFVEQKEMLGLGHAIHAAKAYLKGEVLIMLGDEIFSRSYSEMIRESRSSDQLDAAVGTMVVDNPSHYGMLALDDRGYVTRMVEKPSSFDGNLALAGVYYFKRGEDLADALESLVSRDLNGGEYQLTDALDVMATKGTRFKTFSVGEGYDCGRPESLLLSNIRMLAGNHNVDRETRIVASEIIPPCIVAKNAEISNSTVGPFVSIGNGARVHSSVLSNVIVESETPVEDERVSHSIISNSLTVSLDDENISKIDSLSQKLLEEHSTSA